MDKIKKWLPLGAAVAGVLAVILFIACPALVIDAGYGKADANGIEVMKDGEFVFMILLTLLVAAAAIACSVLSYLTGNKLFALIAAACFAVAAIFFFSTEGFFLTANDWNKIDAAKEAYKLGFGSVIAAILSIVGAGAVALPVVLKD